MLTLTKTTSPKKLYQIESAMQRCWPSCCYSWRASPSPILFKDNIKKRIFRQFYRILEYLVKQAYMFQTISARYILYNTYIQSLPHLFDIWKLKKKNLNKIYRIYRMTKNLIFLLWYVYVIESVISWFLKIADFQ